jgi:hypothetical protein
MPEHEARCFVLHVKEIELLRQPPVVALLGFFEHVQIGVLLFFLRPRGAVNPLQHFVLGIAAPVRAGQLHQLEDFELSGRRHVRAAAQVDEIAFTIQRHVFPLRNRRDDLGFVMLADRFEKLDRLVARPHFARHAQIALRKFGHAFLDRREVLGRERALVRKIVVEAVLDHRPYCHLRVGKQFLHRVREQMRG